ncbi:MAG TPA: SurA N-terminal domain-containing protein [SAR86 cluster bacterium]|jgi:peptidyl-prolyl cis-trans isomerase D|nr:SurA N-terminal domain-containing protein [SAR86 cluster bacterium]HJM15280.1 SurA N-terminal domain-containing protein [SAR86 cluster bacterium]
MAGMQNIREGLTGNLTKIIVIAIIITFVGSIGWAGFFSQGNANIIAKIGSKQITSTDLSFEAASQQFLLNQRFPDQKIEDEVLMEISIESLIRKFGILDFIESNDLNLTDSFVFRELAKDEQFQENGRFSEQTFEAYARSNGFIPQDYLNRIKQDLVLEFWKQSLIKSSFLSEEEVQESLTLAEQERDISFIRIPATNFSEEVETSETTLLDFYNENITEYVTEKKTRVNYLSLSAEDLKSSIDIEDSDIEEEYQRYADEFDTTVRKSVSHIMLNIDSDKTKQEAIKVLENTKARLSAGEDFSALVAEISEDEGTKESGGNLGVTDGTLLPPEFEEVLSDMNEGEFYGPIELNSSVHLIKLTKREIPTPKSIEEMQAQIKESLITESALADYSDLLDKSSDLVFTMGSISVIAEELNLQSTDSGLFSINEVTEDLNAAPILEIIFDTNLDNNLIELIETSDKTAILFERSEFHDEKIIDFNSIKEEVSQDYKSLATERLANEFVNKTLANLNEGQDLNSVASNSDFKLETYKGLKRDSSLLTSQAIASIFNLPRSKAGNVHGSSVSKNGDYLIYRLDSVESKVTQMDAETKKGFSDYLTDQRTLSEYSELSFAFQENSEVTRPN